MQNKDYPRLLDCPFCGGRAKFVHIFQNPEKCMVSCRECDGGIDAVFADEEKAIAAWNRRAKPANSRFAGSHIWEPGDKLDTLSDKCDVLIKAADIKALMQPENKPLTLDELRGMDGDKISIHYIGQCEGFYEDVIAPYYGQTEQYIGRENGGLTAVYLPLSGYGVGWLAYRRNPEGSENDG